jgi:hypothetical protein
VDQVSRSDRLVWSFWLAAGIAFIGGLWPLVFGGTSSRVALAVIPFTFGAAALAACGFFYRQGRAITAVIYFVGGLALVYGLLSMLAVPLELAVLGSCPAPPAPCAPGVGQPLTAGENTGIGFASGFALAAIFVGFFGLMVVFRKPVLPPQAPPMERKIPPVTDAEPAQEVKPSATTSAEGPTSNGAEPDELALEELPPHVEEELPELPPHESSPPTN